MAADEQLISEKQRDGDGLLGSLPHTVPDWQRQQILSQLVLTPTVMTLCDLPEALTGALVEERILTSCRKPSVLLKHEQFPAEAIAGLIIAKRQKMPKEDWNDLISRCDKVLTEMSDARKSDGRDSGRFQIEIQDVLAQVGIEFERSYTTTERSRADEWSQVLEAAGPVLLAMETYATINTAALESNAMAFLPLHTVDSRRHGVISLTKPSPSEITMKLYRVAADRLGRMPFRSTLRETLELARQPGTQALREKIAEWHQLIGKPGCYDDYRRVEEDIAKAKAALRVVDEVAGVSRFATWVAVPITLAELGLQLPPILGLAVSAVGCLATMSAQTKTEELRWISYGCC